MNISRCAILGPGLLGGSIALAWRARQPTSHVALWARREAALAEAERTGLADLVSADLRAVVQDAQLIVLCVPIGAMPALAQQIEPLIRADAIITDVGSVKGSVVPELSAIFKQRGHFVGSHPMAGSERKGLAAARADLFENAVCLVTPDSSTDSEAAAAVAGFWESLGGRVRTLAPLLHDEIVAAVSHLPHLVAAALVQVAVATEAQALDFSGPGFRDTTRVASGPPEMWAEILAENRVALAAPLHAMIEKLRNVLKLLETADSPALERFLTEAKTRRDELKKHTK